MIIGQNVGEYVKKYNLLSRAEVDGPWASSFVSWCYDKDIYYFPPNANIKHLEQYFISTKSIYSISQSIPEPGDIYFYDWKGNRAVGIVNDFSKTDTTFNGIEGDSNDIDTGPAYKVAKVHFTKNEVNNGNFTFVRIKQK